MSQSELLRRSIEFLESQRIPYLLTGSLASSLQGEPRATHDIDLLIAIDESHIDSVLNEFPPPDYYLSREAIREAIATRRMFNLLEIGSGDKVDFWLITDSPFDQSRFGRGQRDEVEGIEVNVSAPEDTILMKLLWAVRSGGSEKQFQDALRVYEVQFGRLDMDYLARWIGPLGIAELWQRLLDQAEPITDQ